MSNLNFHHLRYFQAVAEDGNLTRAASRLNLSQSALSFQIKQLEGQLGHLLFERRGRQLHLTEAGRIALDHAKSIFATGDELLLSLADAGRPRKVVRVGALATLSRNFQISFLKPILGRQDIDIVLRSGTAAELLRGLEALALDLVLINQPPAQDAVTPFVSHRLEEQSVSLVGQPEWVRDGDSLETLLARHPVIVPTADSGIRTGFDALVSLRGIRPQIAAEVDDMAMMRLLAREGLGLAVLPPIVVKDELTSGLLVEAIRLPEITETFFAVTLDRKFPSPLVRDLIGSAPRP
jgi:LysR family transcriptional activator of nhaA